MTYKIWSIATMSILQERVLWYQWPTCISICTFSRIPGHTNTLFKLWPNPRKTTSL